MNSYDLPDIEEIQAILADSSRGPLKAKDLARELDVSTDAYRPFKDRLREYETSGDLYRNRGGRYAVPDRIHLVVGPLQITRAGDGFVRREPGAGDDIFVASRDLDSAMDGDRVVARIESRPRGRNPVGKIVKILERGRPTIVGTYHRTGSFGFARPLDQKVNRDVMIPKGSGEVADEGDVVLVRISQFGSARRNSVGSIEKVLGPMDEPGVDVLAILHGHGLPKEFPEQVESAAEKATGRMQEPGAREDLRDLLVFTIDPSDAKDHDDALSLERVSDGVWEVGIHIADVSHFVEEGSALDLEAVNRGTSVYLVDQVVPMLPEVLSNDLCSLKDGVDRLALSLFATVDDQGRVHRHRYVRSLIRSAHSFHYGQVQKVLNGDDSLGADVDDVLLTLGRLAKTLRRRRKERGSLDFDLPEARVVLDEHGDPVDIQRVVQMESHRLIESFMLLANELVASDCVSRKLPAPFRVHEAPPRDRLETLNEILKPFGHSFGDRHLVPRDLQQLLTKVDGRPEENLITTAVLRAMSRARYDESNLGHFGLASEAYVHFTSPIRRYPDLMVHRIIKKVLIGGEESPSRWGERLPEIAERVSEREQVAQRAERDSIDMKKIEYMKRHLGDEFDGTIAGVVPFGFFVLLDHVFVEGLVHVSTLGDDYYTFVPESYSLVGDRNGRKFRIGDRVRVQVARADKEERKIDFQLLERSGGRSGGGRTSKGGKQGGNGGSGGKGRGGGGKRKRSR